ncbi:stage V sporulation protein AC [Sedimentibacter sp. zth1]|uniref:stage V sporulation protein AC n=1 Tax=Sedimentibacter sp. zth1 TaxID=2816908 RepID=UPI001A918AEB|nr:stage V sporulation protein AC [Sedimentibacter sp. zth1]QSX06388.1 stage V sporulation protein AC [Sedimentibacter sp. zth1]
MKQNKQTYAKVVDEFTPKNKIIKNCILAFIFGGAICTIGEVVKNILINLNFTSEDAGTMSSVILIGMTALLTGFGVYDKLGKYGGAGTIVPITGFANSVVAPALEFKREGYVLGSAAKIFTIAGPVLLFGYSSSMLVGFISYVLKLFGF